MIFHHRDSKSGLTLIEIMIALTMTLIVLGAMMQAFDFASKEMARGRAVIEMSNQVRAVETLLRQDLENLTTAPIPATLAREPMGYFEIIEGAGTDDTGTYLGDVDDIMAMTVRSPNVPFRGRYRGGVLESNLAEIIWFTIHNDRNGNGIVDFDESVDLYRRVLLIRPDLDDPALMPDDTGTYTTRWQESTAFALEPNFLSTNDISVRINADGSYTPNSLEDLARRENRFGRLPYAAANFPFHMGRGLLNTIDGTDSTTSIVAGGNLAGGGFEFTGQNIVLTNVAGFDIRVFATNASVVLASATANRWNDAGGPILTTPVEPGIATYDAAGDFATQGTPVEVGAFVDLGHTRAGVVTTAAITGYTPYDFETMETAKSQMQALALADSVFCTWSNTYEYDGINQDGDAATDEAANGIDDDTANGVDDPGEMETLPPYPFALRGVKVAIRVVEKKSKQVRQSSVVHSFVPQ